MLPAAAPRRIFAVLCRNPEKTLKGHRTFHCNKEMHNYGCGKFNLASVLWISASSPYQQTLHSLYKYSRLHSLRNLSCSPLVSPVSRLP
ncbi:uncharacterized protein VTP21DRAFT_147 [Calcarisporiella thermophila]|uniref:uncharacterized protein n=1 Tax=Calcarisporiella thermophila TaxID=911321 RepID=UPI003742FD9A